MRKELEDRLGENFPFMKKRASLREQLSTGCIVDLYGAFGLECGDGWYDLIYDLCSEIMEAYQEENRPLDIEITQIKEKYGTLRFYYIFEGQNPVIHAFDLIGEEGIRFTPGNSDFRKRISDIILKYEEKSETVCEMCGRPGILRTDRDWIQTLCDCCANKDSGNVIIT